jgi:hypothetical protein
MKKSFVIAAVVCALGGTASAQDDLEGGTDATEETTTETTETTAEPAATSSEPAEGGAAEGYKWGIEASLNSAADLDAVHLLINLGGNYLDIGADFNLTDTDAGTTWATEIEVGYRMQRTLAGRIRPYIKPFGIFALEDEGEDTPITIGAGAAFGVDFELFPQFTLGTELGGAFTYTTADAGDVIAFDVGTAAINATFWW